MSLDGTTTGLKAAIASWLKRSDLTSVMDDLITLAEERISTDLLLRTQLVEGTLTTVAGVQDVVMPTGLIEIENLSIASPVRQLTYVNIEHLDSKYPSDVTGLPSVYTIEGNEIYFGPSPDAVYTIEILYYQKFPSLLTNTTNTLLTTFPSIYLWACLAESATFTMDDSRTALFESKYQSAVNKASHRDDSAVHSGSALRVRRI